MGKCVGVWRSVRGGVRGVREMWKSVLGCKDR